MSKVTEDIGCMMFQKKRYNGIGFIKEAKSWDQLIRLRREFLSALCLPQVFLYNIISTVPYVKHNTVMLYTVIKITLYSWTYRTWILAYTVYCLHFKKKK